MIVPIQKSVLLTDTRMSAFLPAIHALGRKMELNCSNIIIPSKLNLTTYMNRCPASVNYLFIAHILTILTPLRGVLSHNNRSLVANRLYRLCLDADITAGVFEYPPTFTSQGCHGKPSFYHFAGFFLTKILDEFMFSIKEATF